MKNKWNSDYLLLVLTNLVITVLVVFLVSSQSGVQGIPGSSGLPGSIGPVGPSGSQGNDGNDGETPYIGSNGNWWIGSSDTGVTTLTSTVEDDFVLNFQSNYPIQDAIEAYDDFRLDHPFLGESSSTYALDLVEDGYIGISTAEQFFAISTDPYADYVLLNDLDFTGIDWSTMESFYGVLDGAGFSLIGLQSAEYTSSNTSDVALFSTVENARIQNVVIDSFNFDYPVDQSSYVRNAFLAGLVIESTLSNIHLYDNEFSSHGDSAFLVSRAVRTNFYNISITNSVMTGSNSVGGVVYSSSYSTFVDITILDSQITLFDYQGGFISSYGFSNVAYDLTIESSELFIDAFENQGYVSKQNIGLAFGNIENMIIDQVNVIDSMLEVLNQGSQEAYYFYNLGAVIGRGYAVMLSNVDVSSDLEYGILFPDFDVDMSEPIIEYVGGVAGYLNNYILLNVVNRSNISVSFIMDDHYDSIEAIAGVLGYSSGQGYFYNVLNEGFVFGSVDVGGILGGVGFAQTSGRISMVQVANTGPIVGSTAVGGLIGSLDGLTSLSVKHAFQDSYVIGAYEVGGAIGFVSVEDPGIEVRFSHMVVRGFVYGLDVIGGFAGVVGYNMFNPNVGFISLSTIIIENTVQSMFLGLVYGEGVYIDFVDYDFDLVEFYGNNVGLVFGLVDPMLTIENLFVIQPLITTQLFDFDFSDDDTRFDYEIEGYIVAVPYRFYGEIFIDRETNAWFTNEITLRLFSSQLWQRTSTGFTLTNIELSEPFEELDELGLHTLFKQYIAYFIGDYFVG